MRRRADEDELLKQLASVPAVYVSVLAPHFQVDVLCVVVGYYKQKITFEQPISALQLLLQFLPFKNSVYFD